MINLLEHEPVHVAGVLVKAFPQNCQNLANQLNALPGTEVHEITTEGAMVVTVESSDKEKNIVDIITHLSQLDGVLDTSLIFHHNDAGLVPHQPKSPNEPINFR
ncbi:MAG: chaperone NapD [Gammaproteobacteria bacterium]|nr:chaperone NapD [Gammaproteobacteria bacterium]